MLEQADQPELTEAVDALLGQYANAAAQLAFYLMDLGITPPRLPERVLEAIGSHGVLETGNLPIQDADYLPYLQQLAAPRKELRGRPPKTE